jgi:hypothetical protein
MIVRPATLEAALALRAAGPARPLAGGTDIYPAQAAAAAWMRPSNERLLDLTGIDANANVAGDQGFTLAGAPGDGLAKAVLVFAAGVSTLSLFTNGDATADMVITFNADVTGATGHFVL